MLSRAPLEWEVADVWALRSSAQRHGRLVNPKTLKASELATGEAQSRERSSHLESERADAGHRPLAASAQRRAPCLPRSIGAQQRRLLVGRGSLIGSCTAAAACRLRRAAESIERRRNVRVDRPAFSGQVFRDAAGFSDSPAQIASIGITRLPEKLRLPSTTGERCLALIFSRQVVHRQAHLALTPQLMG